MSDDAIKAAEADVEAADAAAKAARKALFEAQKRLGELRCDAIGIHLGDMVRHEGVSYKVTRISAWYNPRKPWLEGVRKLKSGEWSSTHRHLYSDWEKIPETELAAIPDGKGAAPDSVASTRAAPPISEEDDAA